MACVLACHGPVEQADDHRGDVHNGAADARRLLHQPAAVSRAGDDDDRQRDPGTAPVTWPDRPGRGARNHDADHPADPDGLLRDQHRPRVEGVRLMASAIGESVTTSPGRGAFAWRGRLRGNPWRRPWGMEGFTWLYIIWSIVPVAIAVLFSFNRGGSQATWQGFSTKWYVGNQV